MIGWFLLHYELHNIFHEFKTTNQRKHQSINDQGGLRSAGQLKNEVAIIMWMCLLLAEKLLEFNTTACGTAYNRTCSTFSHHRVPSSKPFPKLWYKISPCQWRMKITIVPMLVILMREGGNVSGAFSQFPANAVKPASHHWRRYKKQTKIFVLRMSNSAIKLGVGGGKKWKVGQKDVYD